MISNYIAKLPRPWQEVFAFGYSEAQFEVLMEIVETKYAMGTVFPPRNCLFHALELVDPKSTRVVILGQDPYPTQGNAHGLAFSVLSSSRIPGSLQTLFAELERSIEGWRRPLDGNLEAWAKQGVLLLNTILTVESGQPMSHSTLGWQAFTRAIIRLVQEKSPFVVFMLWGNKAQKAIADAVDISKHAVLQCSHPSRLAQNRLPVSKRFVGSDQFKKANQMLLSRSLKPIDWRL